MREELQLFESDHVRELDYDFLRVFTEFLGLPSSGVRSRIEQFRHWILRIFSTAIDHSVL